MFHRPIGQYGLISTGGQREDGETKFGHEYIEEHV